MDSSGQIRREGCGLLAMGALVLMDLVMLHGLYIPCMQTALYIHHIIESSIPRLLQPTECANITQAEEAQAGVGQDFGKGGSGRAGQGVRCGGSCDDQVLFTQGKVFPKLRKRSPQGSSESASDKEDDEATDYVFRIIYPGTQSEFGECVGSEFQLGYPGCVSSQGHGPDRHMAIRARKWFQRNGLCL